jgi:ArsR family metal-binding transcriptional regulator
MIDMKMLNRAYKMQSAVDLWEDNKKASIEAKFKGIEVIIINE